MRTLLAMLLVSATFCFALGVTQPLLTIKRLVFMTDEPSLLGIVHGLWVSRDWALAIVIGLFSLVLPTVKLTYLNIVALGGTSKRVDSAVRVLANWSMLDVVLVAIFIFAAKTSGLATAIAKPGLWFFTGAVVLTAIASEISRRLKRVSMQQE